MIDVNHQIAAVERRLGTRSLPAGEARVSTVAQTYDTSLEDLWEACTDAGRLARWLGPVSGELRLGGRYQLEGNASGVVERCEPPHGFDATWEFGGEVSWIEVRLTEQPGGRARLQLEHIAHVKQEFWDLYGPGAVGVGWDLGLLGLYLHLAAPGAPRDAAFAEEWPLSEEGRRFVAASSDLWCTADIAAGTDKAAAEAAAERTTAFYTTGPGG